MGMPIIQFIATSFFALLYLNVLTILSYGAQWLCKDTQHFKIILVRFILDREPFFFNCSSGQSRRDLFALSRIGIIWRRIVIVRLSVIQRARRIGVVMVMFMWGVAALSGVIRVGWIIRLWGVVYRCSMRITITIMTGVMGRWRRIIAWIWKGMIRTIMTSCRRLWWISIACACHVRWRIRVMQMMRHHRRREWKLVTNFVEIRLSFHVWEQLSLIWRYSLH